MVLAFLQLSRWGSILGGAEVNEIRQLSIEADINALEKETAFSRHSAVRLYGIRSMAKAIQKTAGRQNRTPIISLEG